MDLGLTEDPDMDSDFSSDITVTFFCDEQHLDSEL